MNHITAQDLPSVPTMSFDSDDVGGGAMMRHSGPRDTRRGKMKKALHITVPAVLALTLSACATAPQQQAAPQTGNAQQQAEIKELKDSLAPLQSFLEEVRELDEDEKDALASLVPVLAAMGDSDGSQSYLESLLDCKKGENRFQRATYSYSNLNALGELKRFFVNGVQSAIEDEMADNTTLIIEPSDNWGNDVVFTLDNPKGVGDIEKIDERVYDVSVEGKLAQVEKKFRAPLTISRTCKPLLFADATRVGNIISGFGDGGTDSTRSCKYTIDYWLVAEEASGTVDIVFDDLRFPDNTGVVVKNRGVGSYTVTVEGVDCNLKNGDPIGGTGRAMVASGSRNKPLVAQYFEVNFELCGPSGKVCPRTLHRSGIVADKPECPPAGWEDFDDDLERLSRRWNPQHVDEGFCVE